MTGDAPLSRAIAQVEAVIRGDAPRPRVETFFDEATFTASHVVADPETGKSAVIDPVLDFDPASGRTSTASAQRIVDHVLAAGIEVEWLLETHAHADHLSAAPWLQERLGGRIAIGRGILAVQAEFGALFDEGPDFARDGSQFDRLIADGDPLPLGNVAGIALHVPGHTPVDTAFAFGDALFVGDTLFMPDYGTARCDFPGGDARSLYRSIRRLMKLPDSTRVFLCHDYKAPGRDSFAWETTMLAERTVNLHIGEGVGEEEFVEMRTRRDSALPVPKLLFPAIQVNMRAGRFPTAAPNGTSYLKLPLDRL